MNKYYPPLHLIKEFNCTHCQVYAAQKWHRLYTNAGRMSGYLSIDDIDYCICTHCEKASFWHKENMIIPSAANVPTHHEDMPLTCIDDYNEARNVISKSPRAAAALLRLVVQKLLDELSVPGKTINENIKLLVKEGLPSEVQKALDYCRVVGNHAVHPGELDLNDTPEIANKLFDMINFIVQNRISNIKEINMLFGGLPNRDIQAINKRDKVNN